MPSPWGLLRLKSAHKFRSRQAYSEMNGILALILLSSFTKLNHDLKQQQQKEAKSQI